MNSLFALSFQAAQPGWEGQSVIAGRHFLLIIFFAHY